LNDLLFQEIRRFLAPALDLAQVQVGLHRRCYPGIALDFREVKHSDMVGRNQVDVGPARDRLEFKALEVRFILVGLTDYDYD
jgi:hypothetical protein